MSSIHGLQIKGREIRERSGLSKSAFKTLLELAELRVSSILPATDTSPLADLSSTDTSSFIEFWKAARCNVNDPESIKRSVDEVVQLAWEWLMFRETTEAASCKRPCSNWVARRQARLSTITIDAQNPPVSHFHGPPAPFIYDPNGPDIQIPASWTVLSYCWSDVLYLQLSLQNWDSIDRFNLDVVTRNLIYQINKVQKGATLKAITMEFKGYKFKVASTKVAAHEWALYSTMSREMKIHIFKVKINAAGDF